jgi:hypothetical protein
MFFIIYETLSYFLENLVTANYFNELIKIKKIKYNILETDASNLNHQLYKEYNRFRNAFSLLICLNILNLFNQDNIIGMISIIYLCILLIHTHICYTQTSELVSAWCHILSQEIETNNYYKDKMQRIKDDVLKVFTEHFKEQVRLYASPLVKYTFLIIGVYSLEYLKIISPIARMVLSDYIIYPLLYFTVIKIICFYTLIFSREAAYLKALALKYSRYLYIGNMCHNNKDNKPNYWKDREKKDFDAKLYQTLCCSKFDKNVSNVCIAVNPDFTMTFYNINFVYNVFKEYEDYIIIACIYLKWQMGLFIVN